MIYTMQCSFTECSHPANAARGFCRTHYSRWQKYGDPSVVRHAVYPSREERFWAKVIMSDNCWLWTGARSQFGYGNLTTAGRQENAHRISWELHFGPIPKGMSVLHRCDVPACVRPDHLWLGNARDNIQDCISKGRRIKATKANGRWRGWGSREATAAVL